MQGDSLQIAAERFSNLLFHQLKAQMPRPGGRHKYSSGNMFANFKLYRTNRGYLLVMSEGVNYSHYAMGYKPDGSKRNPRGPLERKNFNTIENCIRSIARNVASTVGGSVIYT